MGGILVEGSKANYDMLLKNLPNTRPERVTAHYGAICAPPQKTVTFMVGSTAENPSLAAVQGDRGQMSEKYAAEWGHDSREPTVVTPCKTMGEFLEGIDHVDFLSLDVEEAELEVV